MRVMVLVKEDDRSEAGELPPDEVFAEMTKFNEKLVEAGVMLAGEGLAPSSKGKRVAFSVDGSATIIDGPFAEAKELVGGFWIWQVASMEEAVEWIKRSPFRGTEIELRQVMDLDDYGDDIPAAVRESERNMREKLFAAVTDERTVRRTIDAVWRMEAARVIAGLARTVRDIGLAEDLAQDALVAALEQWPESGVPDNPGAWLTAVAKRRYVDRVRRQVTYERKLEEIGRVVTEVENPMDDIEIDTHVSDDVLRLMFTACHPVLAPEARVALTLKMVGGLSTEEIARAFLVPVPTMAARITRAKKALSAADVPFEVPVGDALGERLGSVLEVVYLVFNEGYSATSGASWTRPTLCEEAMRLGRMLAALAPSSAEALALVALMEIQASRLRARVSASGAPITLLEQDRARWDWLLINHALGFLDRALALGGVPGSYLLQAGIAAVHARARTAAATDWSQMASLYESLAALTGSPIVELNRAVAVSMASGPLAALVIVDGLADVPALRSYHLLPAVRADLLAKLGRLSEARIDFERAAALTNNEMERDLMLAPRRDLLRGCNRLHEPQAAVS